MAIDAKQLMEAGWKAREDLDFDRAEKLLTEAKFAFEKLEDWFNVTEALNHLAYTEKLKAVHHNLKGMEYAKEAEKRALAHSVKRQLVLRTLMSLASSAGLFEQALKWGEESLEYFDKPASRGDILAHLATFQLRTGRADAAEKTINEAEALIEKGYNDEREPHRSVWKSKILATKALILYNKGLTKEAKDYLNAAQEIAKKQDLKTRLVEIEAINKLFT